MESLIFPPACRLSLYLLFSLPSLTQALPLPLDAGLREEILMLPSGDGGRERLETTIFRPPGPGPFPLLLMNHGKQPGPARQQPRERFIYMATEFVRRGYAVMLPMRAGYAGSTGAYRDHGCDMAANAAGQARDVDDALAYARRQSWVDASRIVLAGQSYGGLAALSLATQVPPGVRGVLNFAGGLRIDDGVCDWQAALGLAFAALGAASRVPGLWLYGQNDGYFAPPLVRRLHRAYTAAGGQAELLAYGAFKRDAHLTLGSRDGVDVWLAPTERFLRRIGMPAAPVVALPERLDLPATRFASGADIGAVPYLADSGRAAYRAFLGKLQPRAFAVSSSGAWGWAEEGESPEVRALDACQQGSSVPCHLYLVDDHVVWPAGGQ